MLFLFIRKLFSYKKNFKQNFNRKIKRMNSIDLTMKRVQLKFKCVFEKKPDF